MFTRYFTERKVYTLPALATLALLLLAGCSNTTAPTTTTTSLKSGATSTATSTTTTAIANLHHAPVGNANLTWDDTNHMLTVQTSLTDLAPSSTHPLQIVEGSCDNLGKVVYTLPNLSADAHGVVNATTKISVPTGISAGSWALNVYNGPALTSADQSEPIACGDIVNHNTSLKSTQTVSVALQAAPTSAQGQNVTGVTNFTISDHTLKVQMVLSGLLPNSEHMAHIHAGSCASEGPVLYTFPTIKADSAGKATVNATFPNVSSIPTSGWYVNIHRGIDLSTQTGFDPISCGDVVASAA